MVKIAIAGGSGQVAQEVIDALVAAKKHEITVLSRGGSSSSSENDKSVGLVWRTVDYDDPNDLAGALRGIHTVLSFVQLLSDAGNKSQKNLIDAAIKAGVRRFAPSEWGSAGLDDMPWWAGKKEIRDYLQKVNEREKVLEYTLFQPGLFLEYLASPHKTAKHLNPLDTMVDFQNRRAISVQDHEDAIMTLTAVQDLASIVAEAVDYEGEWPVHGGIQGNRLTISQIVKIGEKVRGQPFAIEQVRRQDLEQGKLTTTWKIGKRHSAVKEEEAEAIAKSVMVGILLSSAKGAWDGPDSFNRIFPDYAFNKAEDYLAGVWEGKP